MSTAALTRPLSRRIVLITGAASGLGRATAERFVKQGAKVVLCDLPSSEGSLVEKNLCSSSFDDDTSSRSSILRRAAPAAVFVPTDVTQSDQVTAALDAAEHAYGRPVDTVVNCAGIGLARKTVSSPPPPKRKNHHNNNGDDGGGTIRVHDLESFERVLRVNVVGTFNVIRLAVERMVGVAVAGEENGVLINTASIAAYDGQIGQAAYASSKGAIVGMTLPLARDLAVHGIRVNTVAPGLFRTPLLEGLPPKVQDQLGALVPFPSRLGDPDEYAALVQSIVENPMINAEVIRIDGGLRMPPS